MRFRKLTLIMVPAIVLAGACGKKDAQVATDTSLNKDLTLAGQRTAILDSVSQAERLRAAAVPATPVVHHTTSRVHHSYSEASSGSVASEQGVEVKHTKRDAAIGAAAGAVLGATTSHDKVKGGIIGAAAGGILGGVIGNNVDKSKKP